MKTLNKTVGGNIRRLRKAKKLTQSQLAEELGILLDSVAKYEVGSRLPRPELLKKIAAYFELEVSDLYKDLESPSFNKSEKIPLSRLLELINKKLSTIPDEVYDLAMHVPVDDEIWESIKGALEHAIDRNQRKGSSHTKQA